ncbi:MAG: ABC transporter permease [Candidatus Polarisedimenticolia bacterium]
MTRPFYWSVRREMWENRSIYVAPMIVAAFVLFVSLISMTWLSKRHAPVDTFNVTPAPIMLATFLVGLFYALDALYGERRDRSILFWKSLPVSDRTTVLSKACIPLVVLPMVAFVLSVATLFVLLLLASPIMLWKDVSLATLWTEMRLFQKPLVMLYGLTAHTLWFAPIYAWVLLISAWARRTPVLWVALPLIVISVAERMAFNTSSFLSLIRYRVTGAMTEAFVLNDGRIDRITQLDPARFLSAPGLWLGLAFAAACLAAAVRLRRYREPI